MASEHSALIQQILDQVKGANGINVLLPPTVGDTPKRNELIMFIKPEIFLVDQPAHTQASLEMIFNKLDAFEARVDGVVIVGGPALEEKEIMNRHYGFINEMSRKASTLIPETALWTIGGVGVLVLLGALIWFAIDTASHLRNKFESTICFGIATIFLYHTAINVGMAIGLVPVMGIPLPFLSKGGSSLLLNMSMVGLLLNFYRFRTDHRRS